jgi:hypothetical protein
MMALTRTFRMAGEHSWSVEVTMMKTIIKLLSVLTMAMPLVSSATTSDAVLDWNAIAVNTAAANKANPFAQGRFAAIVQVAVFEAVNSITGEYRPYLGTITGAPGASANAAAVEAAYEVLSAYFGASQSALDADRLASLGQPPYDQSTMDGVAVGHAAAQALIALRAADGATAVPSTTMPGAAAPGVWQLTAGCKAGIAYNWQFVAPFGIRRASDFMLGPPPALTSEAYTKAYNEVMNVGASDSVERTQDRANVVLFFAATSPTQAMNQAARQVAEEKGGTLSENARALALVNMAINDALVASFLNKYHYNFWRPVTAIQGGDTDGNADTAADPDWAPFITTPCFPSYPSNHGSAVNAASEVLRRLYGEAAHPITLANPAVPTIRLEYDSFREICEDVSDARVYGGIHFRTDQEAGADLGRAIGAAVYKLNFQRVEEEQ